MCLGGGGGDGGAGAARKAEEERQRNITEGTQKINEQFGAFTPEYYQKQAEAYQGYAKPSLEQQYQDARQNLIYTLSRSGLLNSSTAADRIRRLEEEKARFGTDVTSRGQEYARRGQADVEDSRSRLISQLTATNDPAAAISSAQREAQRLTQPPSFDPVGNFIFNAAQGLNQYAGPATGYRGLVSGAPLAFSSGGRDSQSTVRY